jgi:two-component system cell cycle sensor histidine kinase/response regulator CckA
MNEEVLYGTIFRRIAVPMFVLRVDSEGDLVFCCINVAFEDATGLRQGDVVGKRPEEVDLFGEDTAALRAYCRRCVEDSEIVMCDLTVAALGQERSRPLLLNPVHDEEGKIALVVGSLAGTLHFQQARDAVRESALRYREVFENISDCIFVLDVTPDGRFRFAEVNPADERSMGYSASEVCGKLVEETVPAELARQITANYRRCLDAGSLITYYEELALPRGRRSFNTTLIPIRDAAGDIRRILGVARDITGQERAENELRESRDLLRAVIDAAPTAIVGLDLDGNVRSIWNPAAERMLGWSAQEAMGRPLPSVPAERQEEFAAFRDRIHRGLTIEGVEVRRQKSDGTPIDYSVYASPLRDAEGKPAGNVAVLVDMTERRQAEDALRDSEHEKTILNRIANIFLTVPDEAMYGEVLAVVLEVMESRFGLFGYIGEDGGLVVPSLTREVWNGCQVPDKSIIFPPDSWGHSLWGRAIREKKAFCSSGSFRTPEGHIAIDSFLTVPIVSGGETLGLVSVANKQGGHSEKDKDLLERIARWISPVLHARLQRDVHERRRIAAEAALRESEQNYRLLINHAQEAIFIVQDEVVKFPNPRTLEMSGCTAEELAQTPFISFVHPADKEGVLEGYAMLLEGRRRPEVRPFRIVNRSGKEIWVQLTAATIVWDTKPGVLCLLRDVTEAKRLEAQFVQVQKMEAVGRIAGGVAHDFNNMLTAIIGTTELAMASVGPTDPLYEDLQEIDQVARRSADLTRQLLAFARKQTIAPKVMNLNDAVLGMLEMLRRLIGEDIDLAWMPGADLWAVKVDPSQIDQILANLCVNARDAIGGVGKVTIETGNVDIDEAYCAGHPGFVSGEHVLLAVSDDGGGMDEETRAHVFEPFFTTKGMGRGTGLGLATVYGIVKQNEGFVNVYSELGLGSTFKIYLPRHEAVPGDTQADRAVTPPRGGTETVLMVEDEKSVLNLGKRILTKLGYRVLIAMTPEKAIRLVEEYPGDIHLLITDVVMPQMNGRVLAERLVAIKPSLKCLYMSGYTANVIVHRGVLDDGVHFLQKPFATDDLASKVREALDEELTRSGQ